MLLGQQLKPLNVFGVIPTEELLQRPLHLRWFDDVDRDRLDDADDDLHDLKPFASQAREIDPRDIQRPPLDVSDRLEGLYPARDVVVAGIDQRKAEGDEAGRYIR